MKHVRIGVIGVSGRGGLSQKWHDPQGRSSLVAGADVNEKHLAEFKDFCGGNVFITGDYREMLARPDVDAVGVFSPDNFHEEHAVAVLEAGKHLFCEKPLAITVAGCYRILRAWKRSGKKFLMGFNMRYMGWVRVMKQIVSEGVIGQVKSVWVRHFVPPGGNWYFHDWHALTRNTTSLLLQKGSHDIDVVHWIAGGHGKRVVAMGKRTYFGGDKPNDLRCDACGERERCMEAQPKDNPRQQCAFRREIDAEDLEHVVWELDNGVLCAYQQCMFPPIMGVHRNYVFIGTEGSVENVERSDCTHVVVQTRRSGKWTGYAHRDYAVKGDSGEHSGADPVIAKEFIDLILKDIAPTAAPLDGRHSVAVGCAAAESLRNGAMPVEIAPLPSDLADLRPAGSPV